MKRFLSLFFVISCKLRTIFTITMKYKKIKEIKWAFLLAHAQMVLLYLSLTSHLNAERL